MIRILQLVSLMAPLAAASSNYTFPSGFDLSQIDSVTRAGYCLGQRNTCPVICGGSAQVNYCDSDTLDFTCTCSNGTDADVSPYINTIPYYVCEANYGQCVQASSTQEGDDECKAANKCGSLNATAIADASSTTTASTTMATTTASATTSGASATTTSDSASPSATGAAVRLMQDHGMKVMATVMLIGFGLAL